MLWLLKHIGCQRSATYYVAQNYIWAAERCCLFCKLWLLRLLPACFKFTNHSQKYSLLWEVIIRQQAIADSLQGSPPDWYLIYLDVTCSNHCRHFIILWKILQTGHSFACSRTWTKTSLAIRTITYWTQHSRPGWCLPSYFLTHWPITGSKPDAKWYGDVQRKQFISVWDVATGSSPLLLPMPISITWTQLPFTSLTFAKVGLFEHTNYPWTSLHSIHCIPVQE